MRTIEAREVAEDADELGVRFKHGNRLLSEQSRRHRAIERRSARNRRHHQEA